MTISDLSPDTLARLEAKLLADLEVVRKVMALLVEHREALGLGAGAAMGAVAPGGKRLRRSVHEACRDGQPERSARRSATGSSEPA